jgi:hypothetical protein
MKHRRVLSLTAGVLLGLGVSIATWAMPQSAHAGKLHLSIGIGIPAPVYVAPPPVIAHPAPIIVHPAPVIVYPPPVAFSAPYGVYGHYFPPGIAKPYYGYHPAYGYKFYKHKKHYRKHPHDDD